MKLTSDVFKFDVPKVTKKIEDFISTKMRELHRDGIVVPISGGLDSSVALMLAVRAVGKEKVVGMMLPEGESSEEATNFGKLIANHAGVQTVAFDIEKVTKAFETYDFDYHLKNQPLHPIEAILNKITTPLKDDSTTKEIRRFHAKLYAKHRIRALFVFRFAEENNLLSVGAAHLTEDLPGLFCKFGVDDIADVMPTKYIFRSHLIQIAEYIDVPKEIRQRSPNPDIVPGITDKYYDILGIKVEDCDLIMFGIRNKKMSNEEIAKQLKMDVDKVQLVRDLMDYSSHKLTPSMGPNLDHMLYATV